MTTYPIFELELLEQWLEMKLRTLDGKVSSDNPLEYSEANLSKAILKFVKFMAAEQRDKQSSKLMSTYEYGLPYYAPTVTTPVAPAGGTSATETICPMCKSQSPGATHCVHRAVYKSQY
jgi:hypothetical protein